MQTLVVSKCHGLAVVEEHVLDWIRNPDPGSNFERATRLVRHLPERLLIPLMLEKRYDGFLLLGEWGIRGNLFFQQRGDSLNLFSIALHLFVREQGWAMHLVREFLLHAWQISEIRMARMSAGGEKSVPVLALWTRVIAGEIDLPFTPIAGKNVGEIIIPARK